MFFQGCVGPNGLHFEARILCQPSTACHLPRLAPEVVFVCILTSQAVPAMHRQCRSVSLWLSDYKEDSVPWAHLGELQQGLNQQFMYLFRDRW
jgi:hypothetical protein